MQPAAIPANEPDRLAHLRKYEILDSRPEADFDEITRLASYICGTPISVMSLIDENRQWFKSRVGLDREQTSRDMAFCAHTILQPDIMVVQDALADTRFADNPLVVGAPHIRFYAGAPLVTPDGYALGSLCAIDHVPRNLKPEQLQALDTLAKQVVKNLELRRSHHQLQEMAHQLGRLNASKDRLFSIVAHDLKSPFSGVLSMLELLAEDADQMPPAELKRSLSMLAASAADTFGLMEKLLQWSTFETGETPFRPVDCLLDDIVRDVVSLFQAGARSKGIELVTVANPEAKLHADTSMVHSVIQNLIANALKFTRHGGSVTLSSRVMDRRVEVVVRDTGVGMSAEHLARARQGESGHSTFGTGGEPGTGLGLGICRGYVERHGGTFAIASELGRGTSFTFTLPLAA